MQPRELSITGDRRFLHIAWDDGKTSLIPAVALWKNCRSALALRRRLDGAETEPSASLSITDIQPVGLYAVNIAFSNGDDRGVYPWAFLAEIAENYAPPRRARS